MGITYSDAKNPKWANAENTMIIMEVNFNHLPEEWVDFCAVAAGDYDHTHELYARAINGDFGPIADFEE